MKTLLERAKPELLAGMELERTKYAATVEQAERFLSKTYYANKITWDIWIDLRSMWLKSTGKLADNPWEVFEEN